MNNSLHLTQQEQVNMLPAFDEHILFALERRYLDFLDISRLELTLNPVVDVYNYEANLRMIKINEVSYHGNVDSGLHLLNMQNVLAALKEPSHSVVNVIQSDGLNTSINYGLSRRIGISATTSTDDYAKMLAQTMHGNFLGVNLSPLNANDTFDEIISPILQQKYITAFPGIPSLRRKDINGPYVQGIDRFIEGMRGEKYTLISIAEPIPIPEIDGMIGNLFDISTDIHSLVKATVQKMKGSSDTVNLGMFGMKGISDSLTSSDSFTDSFSNTISSSETRPGSLISTIPLIGSPLAWLTGSPIGITSSFALSIVNSITSTVATTATNMLAGGGYGGYARSWNRSKAVSQEVLNKTAEHCEKLIDSYISRLQNGKNLGFWNVGIYLLSNNKYTQLRGQGLLRSSLSGDETYWEPIRNIAIDDESLGQYLINFNNPKYNLLMYGTQKKDIEEAATFDAKIKEYAKSVGKSVADVLNLFKKNDDKLKANLLEEIRRSPATYDDATLEKAWDEIKTAHLGHPLTPAMGGVSTPLNTEELSIIMNIPREEIQGISIRESTPFGVNCPTEQDNDNLTIGHIIHKRTIQENLPYKISKPLLNKHAFVCGVTGTGKTNTCMHILKQLDIPFMVIEPAKSEYRQLLSEIPNLKIFTLGNENISPFRINPFEFVPGTQILTHIDYLKSVFNASFPMYASMPYLLEEAIVEIYLDKGWELSTSTNRYFEDNDRELYYDYFPTLEDLFEKIDVVVKSKSYAQELSMDLSAALKARLSSLLTGSKGLMLNTKRSTPIQSILNEPVVIELKSIGDDDEKCFLMGLILSRIYEYREVHHKTNNTLQHLTLIEEAHRLLKNVPDHLSMESANSRGKAVETFSNIISEIREYGEGMMVVDQIPSKLSPDVIKNTSIKIVHRILAQDDRDSVGATMVLNEGQNRELPLLRMGQAVVHREGMDKPFLLQVPNVKDFNSVHISEIEIKESMRSYHDQHKAIFRRLPGLEKDDQYPSIFNTMDFRRFDANAYKFVLASGTLCALNELNSLKQLQKSMQNYFAAHFNNRNEQQCSCRFIWYINRYFVKLNDAYKGYYKDCITAHKALINIWFSNDSSEMSNNNDVFMKSLSNIVKTGDILDVFLSWWILQDTGLSKLKNQLKEPQDLNALNPKLDEFLSRKCKEIVMIDSIDSSKLNALKIATLTLALISQPLASSIIENFKKYLGDKNNG